MHYLSTVAGAASELIKTTNRTDFSFHPLVWTPSGRAPYSGKGVKASFFALSAQENRLALIRKCTRMLAALPSAIADFD
jgi:hypothetical protein